MSNVQIGVGPGAVDSLALVNVDGVTIVGDGVDVPLSATGGVSMFPCLWTKTVNPGDISQPMTTPLTGPSAGGWVATRPGFLVGIGVYRFPFFC